VTLTAPTSGPVSASVPPLGISDLAEHANTKPDAQMLPYVYGGVLVVEGKCGPILGGAYRWLVDQAPGHRTLALPVLKVAEVTAVVDPDGVDHVGRLSGRDVNWTAGLIRVPDCVPGTWQVTCTHARTDQEVANLKLAACIVAKHLWEAQRGGRTVVGPYGETQAAPPSFAIPHRAEQLMEDFTVPGLA
jgi:hypothetical protein